MSQDDAIRAWLTAHIPPHWFALPPDVTTDREEILIIGTLSAEGAEHAAAHAACITRFREATRQERTAIAAAAEEMFGHKVSWGVTCGDVHELFTTMSVPVMTRLRLNERVVLDTLVEAGIARSRSEALSWCVRLVGQHEGEWIQELRDALVHVDRVRAHGPTIV